jgi:Lrp/AsnC family leucine-responsive transcriptional regulator
MDSIDYALLGELMRKGRATWSELAHKVGLSSPGVMDRIRRLEEKRVIRGYRAVIAPEALGLELTAFVLVALEKPTQRSAFLKRVRAFDEIQECHQVTGEYDYLLKIRCAHTRSLDKIVSAGLKTVTGVVKTHISIVMGTEKETGELPLPLDEQNESAS